MSRIQLVTGALALVLLASAVLTYRKHIAGWDQPIYSGYSKDIRIDAHLTSGVEEIRYEIFRYPKKSPLYALAFRSDGSSRKWSRLDPDCPLEGYIGRTKEFGSIATWLVRERVLAMSDSCSDGTVNDKDVISIAILSNGKLSRRMLCDNSRHTIDLQRAMGDVESRISWQTTQ